MRVATITEAKNGLSALLDYVKSGDTVLIVDRGIPVARLESAAGSSDDVGGRLARLQRIGAVRTGMKEPPAELVSRRPPRPRRGASAVRALLDERRGGR